MKSNIKVFITLYFLTMFDFAFAGGTLQGVIPDGQLAAIRLQANEIKVKLFETNEEIREGLLNTESAPDVPGKKFILVDNPTGELEGFPQFDFPEDLGGNALSYPQVWMDGGYVSDDRVISAVKFEQLNREDFNIRYKGYMVEWQQQFKELPGIDGNNRFFGRKAAEGLLDKENITSFYVMQSDGDPLAVVGVSRVGEVATIEFEVVHPSSLVKRSVRRTGHLGRLGSSNRSQVFQSLGDEDSGINIIVVNVDNPRSFESYEASGFQDISCTSSAI